MYAYIYYMFMSLHYLSNAETLCTRKSSLL